MIKILIYIVFISIIFISCKSEPLSIKIMEQVEKGEILSVMKAQEKAWSNHNLENYMNGYWKNDSLKFYGSSGITYGWDKTLANYKKAYPTKDYSGKLNFKVVDISKVTEKSYFVMGEYYLTRKVGNTNGVFMIIFKKIKGTWKIIADTSC
ncbi:Nuclear transport factor 2 family protein [Tenacibaculum aestuariivivum]